MVRETTADRPQGRLPDLDAGTAICGGSAIAAIAPLVSAKESDMSIAMGTVFLLNAVALFLFPWIGHLLHMSDTQFGLWAAIAIHDTSSVIGAASRYSPGAVEIATFTVKLARAPMDHTREHDHPLSSCGSPVHGYASPGSSLFLSAW